MYHDVTSTCFTLLHPKRSSQFSKPSHPGRSDPQITIACIDSKFLSQTTPLLAPKNQPTPTTKPPNLLPMPPPKTPTLSLLQALALATPQPKNRKTTEIEITTGKTYDRTKTPTDRPKTDRRRSAKYARYLEPEERRCLESNVDSIDQRISRLRAERQKAPAHPLLRTFAQLVLTGVGGVGWVGLKSIIWNRFEGSFCSFFGRVLLVLF